MCGARRRFAFSRRARTERVFGTVIVKKAGFGSRNRMAGERFVRHILACVAREHRTAQAVLSRHGLCLAPEESELEARLRM